MNCSRDSRPTRTRLRATESRSTPLMAQAGGTEPSKLLPALNSVAKWVEERL